MAYVANTAFEDRVPYSEPEAVFNIPGIFQTYNSGTSEYEDDVCPAGWLCGKVDLVPCSGYSAYSIDNENTWHMEVCADISDPSNIYFCDTHDINYVVDPVTGATYAIGSNTLGLPSILGKPCNFKPAFFDNKHRYRVGIGNFTSTPTVGEYAVIDDGQLDPASSVPGSGAYFKVVATGTFTQGVYAGFAYYDVIGATV